MSSSTYTEADHKAYAAGVEHGIHLVAQLILAARRNAEERAERERTDREARKAARWHEAPAYDSPQGEREREREEGPWAPE
jgi:hypothetical protein